MIECLSLPLWTFLFTLCCSFYSISELIYSVWGFCLPNNMMKVLEGQHRWCSYIFSLLYALFKYQLVTYVTVTVKWFSIAATKTLWAIFNQNRIQMRAKPCFQLLNYSYNWYNSTKINLRLICRPRLAPIIWALGTLFLWKKKSLVFFAGVIVSKVL